MLEYSEAKITIQKDGAKTKTLPGPSVGQEEIIITEGRHRKNLAQIDALAVSIPLYSKYTSGQKSR